MGSQESDTTERLIHLFYEIRVYVHELSRFLYSCHPHQLFVFLKKTASSLIAKNECFLFLKEITLEVTTLPFLRLGFHFRKQG